MKTLICFSHNNLVKNFCGDNAYLVSKEQFVENINNYKNCIAVCYGMTNYKQLIFAKKQNMDFLYIDNGYFGNLSSYYTSGKTRKNFYRITYNALVSSVITKRPSDRFNEQMNFLKTHYGVDNIIEPYKKNGKDIIIVPPSGKVLKVCNIVQEEWINEVTSKIDTSKYNIVLRGRPNSRSERFSSQPIQELFKNAHATITMNSMASVDSLLCGVPSFIHNNVAKKHMIKSVAKNMSISNLDNLDERLFPNNRLEWLHHLAYGQFSKDEITSGKARKIVLGSINQ